MSKRKADALNTENKDSDSNHIQSLDEQQSHSEESPIELEHIYYEPKKFCDVQINYENKAFHLHSGVLARDSLYFKNLFEEKDMNKEPIELPKMKNFCNVIITADSVKDFFDRIYMHEPILYNEFVAQVPKYESFQLIYLSHYFQAERLEKNLAEFTILVGENCHPSLLSGWYYWEKLNSNTKQQIYLKVLAKQNKAVSEEKQLWREIAREVSETVSNSSAIKEVLPSQGWKMELSDMIAESVLFAAINQKRNMLPI